jgi:exopolysaccharide biosynthesis polyprenyl glycosylphosphotransferase
MALIDGKGPGRVSGSRILNSRSRPDGPLLAAAGAPAAERERVSGLDWRQRYTRYLGVTDLFVIIWAAAGSHFVQSSITRSTTEMDPFAPKSFSTTAAVIVLWALMLSVFDSRDSKVIGFGAEEYKRVLNATFVVFALVTMVSYLFRLELPRSYLLVVMPAGLFGLIAGRFIWRRWLQLQRDRAQFVTNVLAVGNADTVRELIAELRRSPRAGYRVIGACVSGGTPSSAIAGRAVMSQDNILGVPIVGSLNQVLSAVQLTGASAVAVTATAAFGPAAVRELSWELEKTNADLILAPALTDIAGPRVHTHPVAGLPLIHVERPTYSGPTRVFKTAFDMVGAALLLMVFSPIMLVLALAVKVSSPGPVFFRQERVGVDGTRFRMTKFRSMRVDAEALLDELRAQQTDAGNEVLFKIKDDPRITKVGKFLRRFSLDEMPQLFNVLSGEMSLVGPRPPLAAEVAQYQDEVHRRLLVKPGMTGLWQVSGRSDLSWEETVRLDLSYVENWSITGDLVILFKTARAVVSSSGAY